MKAAAAAAAQSTMRSQGLGRCRYQKSDNGANITSPFYETSKIHIPQCEYRMVSMMSALSILVINP